MKNKYSIVELTNNIDIPTDSIKLIEKGNKSLFLINYDQVSSKGNIIKKDVSIEDVMYFLKRG